MAHGWLALTIALLAGISQAVGDSVILIFNRVRPACARAWPGTE